MSPRDTWEGLQQSGVSVTCSFVFMKLQKYCISMRRVAYGYLSWGVGTEVDGCYFVELVEDFGVHVVQLHVPSSQTALSVSTYC